MKHHVTKNLFCIFVVVTKLRATVVVWESNNGIHSLAFGFATQSFSQLTDDTVYATYRRDNPYFVSYPYITVFATITFECKIFMRNIQRNLNRVVSVIQQSGEVGFDVRFVHPVTLFLSHSCMSDRITVLDYIFAFSKILQCEFMSGRNVFVQCNFNAIYRKMLSCREVNNGNGNVVGRINS